MGWLAEEVLRRSTMGKWDWVAETLDAMGAAEVLELSEGCCDTEGRSILEYAAMSVADTKALKAPEFRCILLICLY